MKKVLKENLTQDEINYFNNNMDKLDLSSLMIAIKKTSQWADVNEKSRRDTLRIISDNAKSRFEQEFYKKFPKYETSILLGGTEYILTHVFFPGVYNINYELMFRPKNSEDQLNYITLSNQNNEIKKSGFRNNKLENVVFNDSQSEEMVKDMLNIDSRLFDSSRDINMNETSVSQFKTMVRELLNKKKSEKDILDEEEESQDLTMMLTNALPENVNYEEFAKAVANILKNEYGSHNFEGFLNIINSELQKEKDELNAESPINEVKDLIKRKIEEKKVTKKVTELFGEDFLNESDEEQLQKLKEIASKVI